MPTCRWGASRLMLGVICAARWPPRRPVSCRGKRFSARRAVGRRRHHLALCLRAEETKQSVARAALNTARKRIEDSVLWGPILPASVAEVHAEAFQTVAVQQSAATLQSTGAAQAVVQVPATLVAPSGRIEPVQTTVVLDAALTPRRRTPRRRGPTQRRARSGAFCLHAAQRLVHPTRHDPRRACADTAMAGNDAASQITVSMEAILNEEDAHYVWVVDTQAMTVTNAPSPWATAWAKR